MKRLAFIDKERCVSCGACVKVCPIGAISVWCGCYSVLDEQKCVGCGRCANTCPSGCIEIKAKEVIA